MKIIFKALITAAFLLSHAAVNAETISGKVIKVTDGDTVDILDANYQKHHVRLTGIDAPEKKQAFGSRAQQKLSELVFGRDVDFETRKNDHRGRPVGKLLVASAGCNTCEKNIDAGFEVLKAGLAWHYKQYQREQTPEDRRLYSDAEQAAREQRLGLWADPNPLPPWDWRHHKELR